MQELSCLERDVSFFANGEAMDGIDDDTRIIQELVAWSEHRPAAIAKKIGVANTTLNRPFKGTATSRVSTPTWEKLRKAYPAFPGWGEVQSDVLDTDGELEYVSIDILPSFAGMGGGGSGEGPREVAKLSRRLIVDELQGKPTDFLLINVRGDSMEPDFYNGDQLLVDKRDRSPTQPGPFALWLIDEYVVKNVERLQDGQVKIFSTNTKYTTAYSPSEDIRIIGRPVWYARRL